MSIRTSIALIGILFAISIYTVLLVVYVSTLSQNGSGCIYATLVDSSLYDAKNFTWEQYNSTLIYTALGNKLPLDGGFDDFSDVCRTYLVNLTSISGLASHVSTKPKIRSVVGTRNCVTYLWRIHIQSLSSSLGLYTIFYVIREWRRMFGVVRFEDDAISTARYTKNYAARVISSVLLKTTYTKMSRFMCEIMIYKNALSRTFKDDPISFLFHHPIAAVLIITEGLVRLGAQCLCLATLSMYFVPCEKVLSKWFLSITGIFIGLIICIELSLLLAPGPVDGAAMLGETKQVKKDECALETSPSGVHVFCSNCCASLISNILIKVLYILFMIILIVTIVRYERTLQIALFGRAYLP
ncbi:UL53 [Gallid alphaherpesvirus 2]|uniref:Envelope glycoprotein K n=1 Tax=Gallid herpesvirus 2 strain 814 TaxID=1123959 RepID=G9CUG6_9ALPH|nr:UL53 [Gallid herpesvirus 2 strain 814]AQN77152.1 UL53 [Gallid alphaherpesvirus 2]UOW65028.1 UL53 [Gallid alphaherpesvirus 2]WOL20981.1 UL53 [Gallid alphaherpesvirus 2]WOL21076.1 UL53 [Gallid alphaherpesvirus 2]